jgi:putative NADPH-quinone reductase
VRILYLYCHPLEESFHHAILEASLAALARASHDVDLADLYKEQFDPVLSAAGRRNYHDTSRNQAGVEDYVQRLRAADALVLQFPTWAFGLPAMLKGWLEKVLLPGVAFDLSDPARVKPLLGNIRAVVGISTYGRPRWNAIVVGDPPRKIVTRYLPRFSEHRMKIAYHALYHMNIAYDARRKAFIARIETAMARL